MFITITKSHQKQIKRISFSLVKKENSNRFKQNFTQDEFLKNSFSGKLIQCRINEVLQEPVNILLSKLFLNLQLGVSQNSLTWAMDIWVRVQFPISHSNKKLCLYLLHIDLPNNKPLLWWDQSSHGNSEWAPLLNWLYSLTNHFPESQKLLYRISLASWMLIPHHSPTWPNLTIIFCQQQSLPFLMYSKSFYSTGSPVIDFYINYFIWMLLIDLWNKLSYLALLLERSKRRLSLTLSIGQWMKKIRMRNKMAHPKGPHLLPSMLFSLSIHKKPCTQVPETLFHIQSHLSDTNQSNTFTSGISLYASTSAVSCVALSSIIHRG